MLHRQLALHSTEPVMVGHMAVVYTKEKDDKIIVWFKSRVVTEKRDAELIIDQWKKQLCYGPADGNAKYGTVPVYITSP